MEQKVDLKSFALGVLTGAALAVLGHVLCKKCCCKKAGCGEKGQCCEKKQD